jgi:hypothetical protein
LYYIKVYLNDKNFIILILKKKMKFPKKSHEIWNCFIFNNDKTKVSCEICKQEYNINSSVTNLKNHFVRYHKNEYDQIITKHVEKRFNRNLSLIKKITNNQILNQTTREETNQINNQQTQELENFRSENFKHFDNINNIELDDGCIEVNGLKITGKCKITFK